jgi:putative flippase GtrA
VPSTVARPGLRGTWRALARELSAFGVVGAVSFVLDLGVFQLLYLSGLGAVTAKILATLVSMTVAFLGHRYWSFAHRQQRSLREGYLRFAVINAATLVIGVAIVAAVRYPLGQESVLALQAANVTSIAIGTAVRWLAYRRWVFPAARTAATGAHDGATPVTAGAHGTDGARA